MISKGSLGALGTLAFRPGIHAGQMPSSPQNRVGGEFVNDAQVWAEVELSADKDYGEEAKADKKAGVADGLGRIPKDGMYQWNTSSFTKGSWYIAGAMKINRVLSDEEARQVLLDMGYTEEDRFPLKKYGESGEPKPGYHGKYVIARKKDGDTDLSAYGFDDNGARFSITPAQDSAYLDAVDREDMDTAQRFVDDAANEAGYTKNKAFDALRSAEITLSDFNEICPGVELSHCSEMFAIDIVMHDGSISHKRAPCYAVSGRNNEIESKNFERLSDAVAYVKENGFTSEPRVGPWDESISAWSEIAKDLYQSPSAFFENPVARSAKDYFTKDIERKTTRGEKVFARFGKIPKGGLSKNYVQDTLESGVSVFNAIRVLDGRIVICPETPQQLGTLLHCRAQGRPLYVATGVVNGIGSDGEPTLKSPKIVPATEYTYVAPDLYVKGKSIKSADPVTYDDNGKVIPLSERFNSANDDIRFSISSPVEQRGSLIAVHNLNEENLRDSLKLGGFAMPSIAITKPSLGHDRYGDISLLFGADTINPKNRKNEVYSGDAYTPTFPQIAFKPSEKVMDRISAKYSELNKKYGDKVSALRSFIYEDEVASRLASARGEEELINSLLKDERMMQVFLVDSGKGYVDTITKVTKTRLSDEDVKKFDRVIESVGEKAVKAIKIPAGEKYSEWTKKWLDAYGEKFAAAMGYEKYDDETRNKIRKEDRYRLYEYFLNGSVTTKENPDYEATSKAIRKKAKNGYEKWVHDLFDGIVEKTGIRNKKDTFTSIGNRRSFEQLHDNVSLANVLRAMLREEKRGSGIFGANPFATSTRTFSSISDIHSAEKRLKRIDDKAMDEKRTEINNKLYLIAKKMAKEESWEALDGAQETICDIISHAGDDVNAIKAYVDKEYAGIYNFNATILKGISALVKSVRKLPTEYFEAKPRRAVMFDEVKAAFVPQGTDTVLVKDLIKAGVQDVIEYTDRAQAINDYVESEKGNSIRFSISRQEQEDWNNVIDSVANGTFKPRTDAVVLNRVPSVISKVLNDFYSIDTERRSIIMSQEVLNKSMFGKHCISTDEMKKLIVSLDNPFAVLRSRTRPEDSITVLVAIRDSNGGLSSLAAIDYEAKSGDSSNTLRITSVYGDMRSSKIQMMIDEGGLFYLNRKNISRAFPDRLQLPARNKRVNAKILDENDFSSEQLGIISEFGSDVNSAKSRISHEQDAAYLELAQDPEANRSKLQQMVADAAEKSLSNSKLRDADGNLLKVFHGSPKTDITVFDVRERYSHYKNNAVFFTPDSEYSKGIGFGKNGKVYEAYLNLKNPFFYDRDGLTIGGINIDTEYLGSGSDKVFDVLKKNGYDGIIVGYGDDRYNPDEVVAFNSNQIKSADPVTYDDNANVIPLSERFNSANDDIRFSILGAEGAARLDDAKRELANLSKAKEMLGGRDWSKLSKDDKLKMKIATGWEVGSDGKWRRETEDLNFTPSLFRVFGINSDAFQVWHNDFVRVNDRLPTLADIYANGDLFRAYPALKKIVVQIVRDADINGASALYRPKAGLMFVSKSTANNGSVNAVITHEIQHVVQTVEGFAVGGSIKKASKMQGQIPEKVNKLSQTAPVRELLDFVERLLNSKIPADDVSRMIAEYARKDDTLQEIRDFITYAAHSKLSPFEFYRRLAGEVESRNVETRMEMTDEERARSLLEDTEDVAREDQIVIQDAQDGYAKLDDRVRFSIVQIDGQYATVLNRTSQFQEVNWDDRNEFVQYLETLVGKKAISFADNEPIYIGKDLPKEYARGNLTEKLRRKNKSMYKVYGKSAIHIDELIISSDVRQEEKARHKSRENGVYYRRKVRIIVDGHESVRGYEADLVTYTKDGTEFLYGLSNLQKSQSLTEAYKNARQARGINLTANRDWYEYIIPQFGSDVNSAKSRISHEQDAVKRGDEDAQKFQLRMIQDEDPTATGGPLAPSAVSGNYIKNLYALATQTESLDALVDRKIHDAERPLLDWEKAIGISTEESVYTMMDNEHGRNKRDMLDLEVNHIEPIKEAMETADISPDEMDLYLQAMSGKETNEFILNKEDGAENGSGRSDEEWQAILDKFASGNEFSGYADDDKRALVWKSAADPKHAEVLANIAERVWKMNDEVLSRLVDSGRLAADTAEFYREKRPHYVPFRTAPLDEDDDSTTAPRPGGWGKKEFRSAFGRESVADNALYYSFEQAMRSVVAANRNVTRQALADLVKKHKGTGVIRKGKVTIQRGRVVGGDAAQKGAAFADIAMSDMEYGGEKYPAVVPFKQNGERMFVEILGDNADAVGKAVKRGGYLFWNDRLRWMQTLKNWYARMRTSAVPTFIMRNALIDNRQVIANMYAAGYSWEDIGNFEQNIPGALKTAYGFFRHGKASGEMAQAWNEYTNGGGLIGGLAAKGYEEIEREMLKALRSAKTKQWKVKKAFKYLGERISNINESVESATRFSAYMALRNAGRSVKEAVQFSREVTINFDRKGEFSPVTNTLYMFSNAAVGDIYRSAASFAGQKGKQLAAGLFMVGVLESLLGSSQDDDEDKDGKKWMDVPEYEKELAFIFRVGNYYVRLPVRGLFSAVHYAGVKVGDALFAGQNPGLAFGLTAKKVLGVPLDFLGAGADAPIEQMISPTLGDPVLQLSTGKSWHGTDIYPTSFDSADARSSLSKPGTPEVYKEIASFLNDATGGNKLGKPGVIDAYPEFFQQLTEIALGGVGKDINTLYNAGDALTGGEFEPNDTIIVRDFAREIFDNDRRYWEAKNAFSIAENQIENTKIGSPERRKVLDEYSFLKRTPRAKVNALVSEIKKIKKAEMKETSADAKKKLRKQRVSLQAEVISMIGK